jgi:hypothetical protein|nr:MAG TPA: C2H2 type zinc-finger protein [Caudoviricetes sp.]
MAEQVENVATGESSDSVVIASNSSDKLKAGFEKTLISAESTKQRIEETQKEDGTEIMCNSCGKKFASMAGLKKHWSAKSNECEESKGYREIPLRKISPEERALDGTEAQTPDKLSPVDKARLAAEATAELRASIAGKGSSGNKITVTDLNRCPTMKLEEKLKQTEDGEIVKFIQQRFHPANASRKYLAEKELSNRKK